MTVGEMDALQPSLPALAIGNIPWVLVCTAIGFLILKPLTAIIYNVYFHPLSKYPGPTYATATTLTYWAVTATGDLLPWLQALHTQYGPTVRIGPDRLSYIEPAAWKDIYGHRTGGRRQTSPKDARFYTPELNGRYAINAEPDDAEHARVRRIFSHAFSERALKEQESLFVKYANQLLDAMRRGSQQPQQETAEALLPPSPATQEKQDFVSPSGAAIDIVKLFTCTTFDIMSDLTFGEPLGLLQQSAYTPWVKAIFGWTKAGTLSRMVLEYPLLGTLAKYLTPKSLREMERLHFQHSVDRVDKRIERGSNEPDIWNLVMRAPEGRGLTREEMHAHAGVFMIAGTETSATLLSGLVWMLCRCPEKMRKLVQEVRGGFKSEAELTIEALAKLKYMAACLEEALRLYPPLPIGPPREVCEGGSVICGDWVPGKTRLSVAQYTAYRSPAYFKDPESFVPERWLPGTGYDSDRKDVMEPFSFGPRNCLGRNLAYHEMRIILAKVLWNFDIKLCPESENWIDQKCYTLWEKSPLWVTVTPVR